MDSQFSPLENQVLKILGQRKMSISQIANKVFDKRKTIDPSNTVSSIVRRINRKCYVYELTWRLDGEGGGRGGRTIWKNKITRSKARST